MKKRSELEILIDILLTIQNRTDSIITRISCAVNISHAVAVEKCRILEFNGMLKVDQKDGHGVFSITYKGLLFLDSAEKLMHIARVISPRKAMEHLELYKKDLSNTEKPCLNAALVAVVRSVWVN